MAHPAPAQTVGNARRFLPLMSGMIVGSALGSSSVGAGTNPAVGAMSVIVGLFVGGAVVGATVVVAGVGDCVGVATGMGAQPAPRHCPPQQVPAQ